VSLCHISLMFYGFLLLHVLTVCEAVSKNHAAMLVAYCKVNKELKTYLFVNLIFLSSTCSTIVGSCVLD